MRLGLACALVGFAVVGCGTPARNLKGSPSGAGGQGGTNTAGSGNTSGRAGVGGNVGTGGTGTPAAAGADDNAGTAGMAGSPDEPVDPCLGVPCDAPPAADCLSGTQFQSYDQKGTCAAGKCSYVAHSISCTCMAHTCTTDPCANLPCSTQSPPICKDANTRTSYAATGTCNAGSCSYAATDTPCPFGCAVNACKADPCTTMTCNMPPASICKDTATRTTYASSGTCSSGKCNFATTDAPCSGDTPKCKSGSTGSQCVACLANADCSNGGTCNSSNACVCSARFNGKHCEFQAFRALGMLSGDAYSDASNISHDGSVVVGSSSPSSGTPHAFRSVNGGAMQYIPKPTSATGASYCLAKAVDSANNVLLACDDGEVFLYNTAGVATAVTWPTNSSANDISLDGKVIVGSAGDQAVRRAGSVNTLLGPLQPGGSSSFSATNGDGSIAVGRHTGTYLPIRWTASTGLVALPLLSNWSATGATDVSTDGKVIVGWASLEWEILYGQKAVKWTGTSLTPTVIGEGPVQASATAVNFDGSVIVGGQGSPVVATLWDSAGAHTLKSLLGATSDLTSDWTLDRAFGVSDDGKWVVGTGTHQNHGEAWVAHLP